MVWKCHILKYSATGRHLELFSLLFPGSLCTFSGTFLFDCRNTFCWQFCGSVYYVYTPRFFPCFLPNMTISYTFSLTVLNPNTLNLASVYFFIDKKVDLSFFLNGWIHNMILYMIIRVIIFTIFILKHAAGLIKSVFCLTSQTARACFGVQNQGISTFL